MTSGGRHNSLSNTQCRAKQERESTDYSRSSKPIGAKNTNREPSSPTTPIASKCFECDQCGVCCKGTLIGETDGLDFEREPKNEEL